MKMKKKYLNFVIVCLIAISCIGFVSCGDDDDENNTPSFGWRPERGGNADNGSENNDEVSQTIGKYVTVTSYYKDYAYNITISSRLSDVYKGKVIKYGIEWGYLQNYDYVQYIGTGGEKYTAKAFILSDGEMSIYWGSYNALMNKIESGEKLSEDEKDLLEDLKEILDEEESDALADYCGRIFVEMDGKKYYVYTVK